MATANVHTGTVSHGTLKTGDLLRCFIAVLTAISPDVHRLTLGFAQEALTALSNGDSDGQRDTAAIRENADVALADLFDALNEVAPSGYYFGAHPGDGSDFGFWPIEVEADW